MTHDADRPLTAGELLQSAKQNADFGALWAVQEPKVNLAVNVQRLRAERGLTQAELGAAAGMRQPRIAEIESGHSNPRLDTLSKVARALGTSVEHLFVAPQSNGNDFVTDIATAAATRVRSQAPFAGFGKSVNHYNVTVVVAEAGETLAPDSIDYFAGQGSQVGGSRIQRYQP